MKLKSKKSALVLSFVSLMLCAAMLVGSTFAWFTDTASANVNKIQSGNLDVKLEMLVNGEWKDAEGETLDFKKAAGAESEAILWEPGCTYELPALRVKNNGNLALKYKIQITGIDGDAKLNDAIVWTIDDGSTTALDADHPLAPLATSNALTIKGHMREDAGNEYQNLTIDGIGITVYATQLGGDYTFAESDSNGKTYDENATYPLEIISKIDNAEMKQDAPGSGYVYKNSDETVTVTVPAAAVSEGATPTVTIEPKKNVQTATATAIAAEGKDAVAYEITVSNVPTDNTTPITVKLFVGMGLQNVVVYHSGEKMDSGATYDPATGVLTIITTSFSPFDITFDAPEAAVGSTAYYTLADAVAAAKDGGRVVLMKDVTLTQHVTTSGNMTLDLNGKTITTTATCANGSAFYVANGEVTIKNGKIIGVAGPTGWTSELYKMECDAIIVESTATLEDLEISICSQTGACVYAYDGAKVYVKSGTYSNNTTEFDANGTTKAMLLNQADKVPQAIFVSGGTFYGENPANGDNSGNPATFLAEGCVSVKSGEGWKVEAVRGHSVNGTTYNTLSEAIVAATGDNAVITLGNTSAVLESGVAHENTNARTVTIVGDGTQTVDVITKAVNAEGGMLSYQRGSSFTFENVTIQAGEGSFDGIVCDALTFKDCTIKGKLTLYGAAEFINCKFENTMDDQYSIWTWGGTDVSFENCTFNTNGKAILLYGHSPADKSTNLTVTGCTFNDRKEGAKEKAAIEIGNDYNATYRLTITDITVNGFAEGKNTGSNIWANKNSMDAAHLTVTIDGTQVL